MRFNVTRNIYKINAMYSSKLKGNYSEFNFKRLKERHSSKDYLLYKLIDLFSLHTLGMLVRHAGANFFKNLKTPKAKNSSQINALGWKMIL